MPGLPQDDERNESCGDNPQPDLTNYADNQYQQPLFRSQMHVTYLVMSILKCSSNSEVRSRVIAPRNSDRAHSETGLNWIGSST